MRNLNVGKLGEDLACKFLEKKGYVVLARNYRKPWGEIDVVARARDKTLVFVEVKTMQAGSLTPEDQVTKAKVGKLQRTCRTFCDRNSELIDKIKGWRIDLLAVTILRRQENDLTIDINDCIINHYENI